MANITLGGAVIAAALGEAARAQAPTTPRVRAYVTPQQLARKDNPAAR